MTPADYLAAHYFAARYFVSSGDESSPAPTCDSPVVSNPYGHIPIGVNQPLGGSLYPFVDDAGDSPHSLIADLSLFYDDRECDFVLPFRVKWLFGFGCYAVEDSSSVVPTNAYDICIVDSNNAVVVDTSEDSPTFRERVWTSHQKILEWTTATYTLQIVHATAWSDNLEPIPQPDFLEPLDAWLDSRAVIRNPPRVASLTLNGSDQPPIAWTFAKFAAGSNAKLVITRKAGIRPQTIITFDFTPGGGTGRAVLDCGEDTQPAIRTINGVGPGARQNLRVAAEGCYSVERRITDVLRSEYKDLARKVQVQNGIQLTASCGPQCQCGDYAAVYEAIRRLADQSNAIWEKLTATRELYHANRHRWLLQKICRENAPRLAVVTASYCPCQIGVVAAYRNPSTTCAQNVVIHISFDYADTENCGVAVTSDPANAELNANSMFRGGYADPLQRRAVAREQYQIHGTYPHFWGVIPYVPPQSQGYIQFSLDVPDADCEAGAKMRFIADAYALPVVEDAADGSPVPGYVVGAGPGADALPFRLVDCPVKHVVVLKDADCRDGIIPGSSTSHTTSEGTTSAPTSDGTTSVPTSDGSTTTPPPTTTTTVTTTTTSDCGCDTDALPDPSSLAVGTQITVPCVPITNGTTGDGTTTTGGTGTTGSPTTGDTLGCYLWCGGDVVPAACSIMRFSFGAFTPGGLNPCTANCGQVLPATVDLPITTPAYPGALCSYYKQLLNIVMCGHVWTASMYVTSNQYGRVYGGVGLGRPGEVGGVAYVCNDNSCNCLPGPGESITLHANSFADWPDGCYPPATITVTGVA